MHISPHPNKTCRFKSCDAPSIIEGYCPFHYNLVCQHEMRYLMQNLVYLNDQIFRLLKKDHGIPNNIKKPINIPQECTYFNSPISQSGHMCITYPLFAYTPLCQKQEQDPPICELDKCGYYQQCSNSCHDHEPILYGQTPIPPQTTLIKIPLQPKFPNNNYNIKINIVNIIELGTSAYQTNIIEKEQEFFIVELNRPVNNTNYILDWCASYVE